MKTTLSLAFLALSAISLPGSGAAQEVATPPASIIFDGDVADLSEFVWEKRPLIVFADSPSDPRFIQQIDFLSEGLEDLAERDVVVLTDTDKATGSTLREKFHPRGFMLVLVGKDGTIYLRKPSPWHVREITRVIDKMPLRQQEIRDRRGDS